MSPSNLGRTWANVSKLGQRVRKKYTEHNILLMDVNSRSTV